MPGARHATAAAVAVCLATVCVATASSAAPVRHHAKAHATAPPAAAQSFEARYRACRTEAFRRFGWHYGTRLVLYATFAVEQIDYCVRNGGHF